MTLPKSPMQEEARYQALLLKKEIHEYQKLIGYGEMLQNTPNIGMIGKTPGIYSADAWNVSRQPIEGDFALDPILARTLASRFAKKITDGGWLTDYLNDRPGKGGGLGEYVKDAAFSPESILGNLNQGRQGVEAAAAQMKMNNAVKAVQSGNAQSVKLNNHMTLYNANKSGKGAPRLRLRMTGVTAKLVTPVIDPEIR